MMKMRSKARVVDARVPEAHRLIVEVRPSALGVGMLGGAGLSVILSVDARWTAGRLLDAAATALAVSNTNAGEARADARLFLYASPPSAAHAPVLIPASEPLSPLVPAGSIVLLTRGLIPVPLT